MDPWREELVQNLENYLIGLDDTFQFRCRGCGKCCKNREDIMLTTRDLFNIAKKLNLSPKKAVEQYCHAYIGDTSRIPIVRLSPRGPNKACPLLKDKRCLVHDVKPAVCALYPLGRTIKFQIEPGGEMSASHPEICYILQPVECGSQNRTHTVRDWLMQYITPAHNSRQARGV